MPLTDSTHVDLCKILDEGFPILVRPLDANKMEYICILESLKFVFLGTYLLWQEKVTINFVEK